MPQQIRTKAADKIEHAATFAVDQAEKVISLSIHEFHVQTKRLHQLSRVREQMLIPCLFSERQCGKLNNGRMSPGRRVQRLQQFRIVLSDPIEIDLARAGSRWLTTDESNSHEPCVPELKIITALLQSFVKRINKHPQVFMKMNVLWILFSAERDANDSCPARTLPEEQSTEFRGQEAVAILDRGTRQL